AERGHDVHAEVRSRAGVHPETARHGDRGEHHRDHESTLDVAYGFDASDVSRAGLRLPHSPTNERRHWPDLERENREQETHLRVERVIGDVVRGALLGAAK